MLGAVRRRQTNTSGASGGGGGRARGSGSTMKRGSRAKARRASTPGGARPNGAHHASRTSYGMGLYHVRAKKHGHADDDEDGKTLEAPVFVTFDSMRRSLGESLASSNIGVALDVVNTLLSMLSCILYVWQSYDADLFDNEHEDTFTTLEIVMVCFFAFDYLLRLLLEESPRGYVLSLYGIIDLCTIVPVAVEFLGGFNADDASADLRNFVKVLRLMRVMRVVRVKRLFVYLDNPVDRQIFTMAFTVTSIVFVVGGIVHFVEAEGRTALGIEPLPFHDVLYFMAATLSTAGFGDIVPLTLLGKVITVILLVMVLVVIPKQAEQLLSLLSMVSVYRRARYMGHTKRQSAHIVVMGEVHDEPLREVLTEIFHADHGTDVALHVVVLAPQPPSDYVTSVLTDVVLGDRVTYLQGSPFEEADLQRASAETAAAVFVMANKFATDPDEDDAATLMRSMWVKRYVLERTGRFVFTCAQLMRPSNVFHFRQLNNGYDSTTLAATASLLTKPDRTASGMAGMGFGSDADSHAHLREEGMGSLRLVTDQVVCVDKLKMKLLGKTTLVEGTSTLIANLVTSSDLSLTEGAPWLADYVDGTTYELYCSDVSPAFEGVSFTEAAQIVYDELGSMLFGIQVTPEGFPTRTFLNPGHFVLPNVQKYSIQAFVVAKSPTSADLWLGGAHTAGMRARPVCCRSCNRKAFAQIDHIGDVHEVIRNKLRNCAYRMASVPSEQALVLKQLREGNTGSEHKLRADHAPIMAVATATGPRAGAGGGVGGGGVTGGTGSAVPRRLAPLGPGLGGSERGIAGSSPLRVASARTVMSVPGATESRFDAVSEASGSEGRFDVGGGAADTPARLASPTPTLASDAATARGAAAPLPRSETRTPATDALSSASASASATSTLPKKDSMREKRGRAPLKMALRTTTSSEEPPNRRASDTGIHGLAAPTASIGGKEADESKHHTGSPALGGADPGVLAHPAPSPKPSTPKESPGGLPRRIRRLSQELSPSRGGISSVPAKLITSLKRTLSARNRPSRGGATIHPRDSTDSRGGGGTRTGTTAAQTGVVAGAQAPGGLWYRRMMTSRSMSLYGTQETSRSQRLDGMAFDSLAAYGKDPERFSKAYHVLPQPVSLAAVTVSANSSLSSDFPAVTDHVIVCGNVSNMFDFVLTLRTRYGGVLTPVVLLAEKMSTLDWSRVAMFPWVFFVEGSPLDVVHLRRAGIHRAKQTVIVANSHSMAPVRAISATSDPPQRLVDADTIFTHRTILKEAPRVRITCEILHNDNLPFVNPSALSLQSTADGDLQDMYQLTPHFAAGRVFTSSILDTLLAQSFFNSHVVSLLEQLVEGGNPTRALEDSWSELRDPTLDPLRSRATVLDSVRVPAELHGRSYEELVTHMLKAGLVPLGLYKGIWSTMGHGAMGNHLPYVHTNPAPRTTLHSVDRVFLIADAHTGHRKLTDLVQSAHISMKAVRMSAVDDSGTVNDSGSTVKGAGGASSAARSRGASAHSIASVPGAGGTTPDDSVGGGSTHSAGGLQRTGSSFRSDGGTTAVSASSNNLGGPSNRTASHSSLLHVDVSREERSADALDPRASPVRAGSGPPGSAAASDAARELMEAMRQEMRGINATIHTMHTEMKSHTEASEQRMRDQMQRLRAEVLGEGERDGDGDGDGGSAAETDAKSEDHSAATALTVTDAGLITT